MVIRLGRNGRFLACSLFPEHKESRPLPGEEPPPQAGEGEVCPQCGEGTLVGKRGRFGPFVGCSRYPDCTYIKQGGPAAAGPAPASRSPARRTTTAISSRVARGGPATSSGVLELPEVRLHDELRAGRGGPRHRRRPGRAARRDGDLPRAAARTCRCRRATDLVGARLEGGPPNPEALAKPARGGGASRRVRWLGPQWRSTRPTSGRSGGSTRGGRRAAAQDRDRARRVSRPDGVLRARSGAA